MLLEHLPHFRVLDREEHEALWVGSQERVRRRSGRHAGRRHDAAVSAGTAALIYMQIKSTGKESTTSVRAGFRNRVAHLGWGAVIDKAYRFRGWGAIVEGLIV